MTVQTRRSLVRSVTGTLLALAAWLIRPSAAPGQLSCSDWRFCGLCGCRCACRGGSDTACPVEVFPGAPGGPAVAMPAAVSGSFSTATAVDHCAPASRLAPTLSMGAPAAVPVRGTARNRTGVPVDSARSVRRRWSRRAAECKQTRTATKPYTPSSAVEALFQRPVTTGERRPHGRGAQPILAVCPLGSCLQPAARPV
jgi:hypothetical protein